jgi:hypothetical protein
MSLSPMRWDNSTFYTLGISWILGLSQDGVGTLKVSGGWAPLIDLMFSK